MHIHIYMYTQTSMQICQIPPMNTYTFHDFSYKIKTLISVKDQALSMSLFPKKVLVLSNNYNKAHLLACDYQEAVFGEDQ